jgi:DNA polymerase-3 subunit gamma/tau
MPEPQSPLQPTPRTETKSESRTAAKVEATAEALRDAVLGALSDQQMLVSLLESAEWTLTGNSLTAKVTASGTMIEMSFTAEARRIASAAASGLAGRPIKLQVEPSGTTKAVSAPRRAAISASNASARSRAEQDPIVQRMKEKFGAEIRTVIDYREKG